MATVQLSGDFSEAVTTTDIEVADARPIMLRLLSTIVLANGDVHSPQRWIISLTAGAFSRYLVVPDDATAARYSIILPDGAEQVFTLASGDGPTITVAEVLLLNLVDIEPDALAALLALYTPLATYTPAVAALQADIDTRATAAVLTAHTGNTSNPHSVTAAQVGAYTSGAVDTLLSAKEASLGTPGTSGYVLSSTTGGLRSWIAPGGGGGSALTWIPITAGSGPGTFDGSGWANLGTGYAMAYAVDSTFLYLSGWIWRSAGVPAGASTIMIVPGITTTARQDARVFGNVDGRISMVAGSGANAIIQFFSGGSQLYIDGISFVLNRG